MEQFLLQLELGLVAVIRTVLFFWKSVPLVNELVSVLLSNGEIALDCALATVRSGNKLVRVARVAFSKIV